jgi:hypothetical protein
VTRAVEIGGDNVPWATVRAISLLACLSASALAAFHRLVLLFPLLLLACRLPLLFP